MRAGRETYRHTYKAKGIIEVRHKELKKLMEEFRIARANRICAICRRTRDTHYDMRYCYGKKHPEIFIPLSSKQEAWEQLTTKFHIRYFITSNGGLA